MEMHDRLVAARDKASLSIADMATWFDCNQGTMRTWLAGAEPLGFRRPQIDDKLDLLEHAIEQGGYFPVPLSITQYNRKDYVKSIRDGLAETISKSHSAE